MVYRRGAITPCANLDVGRTESPGQFLDPLQAMASGDCRGTSGQLRPPTEGRILSRPCGFRSMRVIALIEDPQIIRRILEHLGLWVPQVKERSPPLDPASWPRYASLPLTYHPVPDIASSAARAAPRA